MQSLSVVPSAPETSLLARFESQVNSLCSQLVRLNDDELFQLAVSAKRLETSAFRLRGACVAELRHRAQRLVGGRGKRDVTGAGIGANLSRLANEVGVSVSTLQTDAQIHEVFFSGETTLECETTFPREYYVTALAAPDPVQAINLAHEQTAKGSYNRDQFRKEVKILKQVAMQNTTPPHSETAGAAIKNNRRIQILPEALDALAELVKQKNQSAEVVVAQALLLYLRSLTDGQAMVQNSKLPADSRPNGSSSKYEQPYLPMSL